MSRLEISNPRVLAANPVLVLALLAGLHFLVDVTAGVTNPVWPSLEEDMDTGKGGLLWVYVCWSIATSMGQLLFGWWADRRPSPWLIWAGPLAGVICISCMGLVDSPSRLAMLLAVGGLGIAAFHPEAAANAGALIPEQRSRVMAIFALAGYLGQAVGPVYCGLVDRQFGLPGLAFGMGWSLPLLAILWLGVKRYRNDPATPKNLVPTKPHARTENGETPYAMLLLLLSVGALRILPALGVPLAVAYLLKDNNASTAVIGAVQSAFMAGIGVGGIACATMLRPRWEFTALWLFPLLSTPLLGALAFADGWILVALVGVCGVLLGVTMPVFISFGQRLLPNSQRVASSITMGVSWGVASGFVASAMWLLTQWDRMASIFWFFAASSLLSSLLCALLPRTEFGR